MYVYKGNTIQKILMCWTARALDIPYLNGRDNPASTLESLNLKLFQSFFLRTNSPSFI